MLVRRYGIRRVLGVFLIVVFAFSLLFANFGVLKADPSVGDSDWAMYQHDTTHSGSSPSSAPNTNNTLWKDPIYVTGDASVAVVNGEVYTGSVNSQVYCLNAATGAVIWNYTIKPTLIGIADSPAVVNGKVYVGSYPQLYCLDSATGNLLWNYSTGNTVESSPTIANGYVYVGSNDDRVYCLNAATGALVWNYTTGGGVPSSPAVANGVVYVGSYDNKFYALNATTGSKIWSYSMGFVFSSPTVVGNEVYVGSVGGNLYCLNATTGALVWSYLTGARIDSTPAVANGRVYIGAEDNKTYCINAATGAFIWSYTTGGNVESSPAVAGGNVYVGSMDNKFYCLNAVTGALIWSYNTGDYITDNPAVANGVVYVGGFDGNLYAFGSLPALSVLPASANSDVSQPCTFEATASGGSGTYMSYQWYLNGVAQTGQNSATFSFIPPLAGSYFITATVTDSLNLTSAQATSAVATAYSALAAPTISPSLGTVEQGQTSSLSSSAATAGCPPYTYQWFESAPGGSYVTVGSNSTRFDFITSSSTASGSWGFILQVTDGAGTVVKSNPVAVTVGPAPTAMPSPTPAPTPSPSPTATPTPLPAASPTPAVTASPSPAAPEFSGVFFLPLLLSIFCVALLLRRRKNV